MKKFFILFICLGALAGCQHVHNGHPCTYYKEKLETPVYFRFNEAEITPKAQASIDEGIEYLYSHRFRKIKIDAYADPLGTEEYNMDLTERRANAIRDYITSKGISKDRVEIEWHGIEQDSGQGYHEHRRVDISVM